MNKNHTSSDESKSYTDSQIKKINRPDSKSELSTSTVAALYEAEILLPKIIKRQWLLILLIIVGMLPPILDFATDYYNS